MDPQDGRVLLLGVGDIGPSYEPTSDYQSTFQSSLDAGDSPIRALREGVLDAW